MWLEPHYGRRCSLLVEDSSSWRKWEGFGRMLSDDEIINFQLSLVSLVNKKIKERTGGEGTIFCTIDWLNTVNGKCGVIDCSKRQPRVLRSPLTSGNFIVYFAKDMQSRRVAYFLFFFWSSRCVSRCLSRRDTFMKENSGRTRGKREYRNAFDITPVYLRARLSVNFSK